MTVVKSVLGAALGAGLLACTAGTASAAIACSGNVCWHVHESYHYPRAARVIIHPDNWHWGPREHFVFREHAGRGYWAGRRWREW